MDRRGKVGEAKWCNGKTWLVRVGSGDDQREWAVHEELLRRDSGYFQAATKKEWQGEGDRTITLDEDEPKIFEVYVGWLYKDRIFVSATDGDEDQSAELNLLVESYILGEKIQDHRFQNEVMESLIACTTTPDKAGNLWYPTGSVNRIYEGTVVGSPVRALMVDMFLTCGDKEWLNESQHSDFLLDLCKGLYDSRKEARPKPTLTLASRYYRQKEPAPSEGASSGLEIVDKPLNTQST